MRRDHGADDLGARLLVGLVHRAAVELGKLRSRGAHLEAVPGKLDVVGRIALPDGEDHVDRLGEDLVAVFIEDPERFRIGGERPGADAEDEAALREVIEHRRVRGDQRRMRMRQIRGSGGELDRLRLADQRGEKDEAVGDVLAAVGEVLADERVVEAEPVGEDHRLAVFLQRLQRMPMRRMHRHHEQP